jgi:hypothetical protein
MQTFWLICLKRTTPLRKHMQRQEYLMKRTFQKQGGREGYWNDPSGFIKVGELHK